MPSARKEIANATVALDGRIFVAGGVDSDGGTSSRLEAFDPSMNSWTRLANMPLSVWRACAAAVDGRLYVFGGYRTSQFPFSPSNRVFAYDPATNSWEEQTRMSQPRGACVAVAVEETIHVFGGLGGSSNRDMNLHEVFTPSTNSWRTEAPMPRSLSGLSGVLLEGRIYLMGGYRFEPSLVSQNRLETYDPATKTWTTRQAMPAPRHGIDAVVLDQKIVVFGGRTTPNVPSATLLYDPAIDQWNQQTNMPRPVSFMGAAVVQDTAFVIGGGAINLNRFDGLSLNRAFTLSSTSTVHETPARILSTDLLPNYPNPFVNHTTLVFVLAHPSRVTLTLHNLLGQTVATLATHRPFDAGTHYLAFDGSFLPSGTYVQLLRVTPFADTSSFQRQGLLTVMR